MTPQDAQRASAGRRMRGWFYAITGEPQRAYDDFDAALDLDPDNLPARYLRAKVARHLKRGTESLAGLREYLERAPRDELNLPQVYYETVMVGAGQDRAHYALQRQRAKKRERSPPRADPGPWACAARVSTQAAG